ncbi:MAG TPA: protein YgfX, partial [Rhodocyclaceae bacterium]|nr:protein YgfX [Rhodocyclaceae bacterium]
MLLPVTLDIRRSRSLIAALTLAHLLAAAGLLPTDLPLALKAALWLALASSLAVLIRRPPMAGLAFNATGHLSLLRPDGSSIAVGVDPATTVLPWLIVLLVKTADGGKEAHVLPVDALGERGHRQLRL